MKRHTILQLIFFGALSHAAPNVQRKLQNRGILTFDYVIVGGGTAGLVMANRLSESGAYQVAVIEAGGYYELEDPTAVIPGLDVIGVGSSPSDTNDIDWNFVTAPQTALNNRQIHYARGKCLGGRQVQLIIT
jgi:choline dehydrogenase